MFHKDWNKVYKEKKQIIHWPWDDLISNFNIFFKNKKKLRVLELGFGTGGNALFFLSNGIDYYGVEGSIHAVNIAKKKFPKKKNRFICQDFTKKLKFKKKFDLIFDRGSITHNQDKEVKVIIDQTYNLLKKNGYFFGIDWFSKNHYMSKKGTIFSKDKNTKIFKNGPLRQVGQVNFFSKQRLKKFFKKFKLIKIDDKIKKVIINNKTQQKIGFYNIITKK